MANNPSLSEFMAQAQRGLYQNSLGGPDFLKKAAAGIGTPATLDPSTGIFDTTYGRKVWQALNNQTRFFNAIPRTVWGNTAGWRIRSGRGSQRSTPITETGTLPVIDVSDIETVSSLPRIVATTFGASVKAVFSAQLEGGVGDVLALENENAQLDHVKEIQQELLAPSVWRATDGGTTYFDVPNAVGLRFRVGDSVSQNANGTFGVTTGNVISAITQSHSTGTARITITDTQTTYASTSLAMMYSRAGMTSLDDIVSEDGALIGGVALGANARAYDLTQAGRTAGQWDAGAYVSVASGVGRDLTLTMLDTSIQKIRENGGEPKLILLGHDQYFKLERLLNSQQRYMGQEEYQVGVGSERTFPGTRTGLVLATYQGIPILPDADVFGTPSSTGTVQGSNVYVLDTDYLEIAVAQPTQYIENRDYFAANSLVVRGLLYTMAELRCKNFFVQAKIGDLTA